MVYVIQVADSLLASFQQIFEKLVHLVGFIIRIYHDAQSPEHQTLGMSQVLQQEECWSLISSMTLVKTVPR